MSDIKMSDVFELPTKAKLINGDARILLSSRNIMITSFSGIPNAAQHMATAINAYDANQERIADLDELRKNSMECIKSQRDEITDQAEEIKAQAAHIKNLTECLELLNLAVEKSLKHLTRNKS